jgi:uncharacterized protein (DUF433 family)
MRKTTADIYGNQDPRELPAYPPVEAARYLGLPVSTLRAWTRGQRGFKPILTLPADSDGQLSFYNLVEAFVANGLRRKHSVPVQRLRRAVDSLSRLAPHSKHPLAELDLQTFARDVFLDESGAIVNVSRGGQLGVRELLQDVLERVERDVSGHVARLYPISRPESPISPRVIVIDPRIQFGRPVIAGTGIPTSVLRERWKAGDSVASLAEDYDRTTDEIEEALRYEAA